MRKILLTIIIALTFTSSVYASTDGLSREFIYRIADGSFIEMTLKSDLRDKALQKYIYDLCKEKDISYSDFLILAYKESTMKANALNYNEAKYDKNGNEYMTESYDVGLMQINIPADELENRQDLFNAKTNVKKAINIIKSIDDRYDIQDRLELMVAYNMGAGGLERYRNGELTLSEKWLDKQEECEKYVEDQIKSGIDKLVEKGCMAVAIIKLN